MLRPQEARKEFAGKRYYRLRTSLLSLPKQGLRMHMEWCGLGAAVSPSVNRMCCRNEASLPGRGLRTRGPLPRALCLLGLPQPFETPGVYRSDPDVQFVFVPSSSLPRSGSLGHSVHSVQLLNRVRPFVTPWTAAHQASLSITNSRSPLKRMSPGS